MNHSTRHSILQKYAYEHQKEYQVGEFLWILKQEIYYGTTYDSYRKLKLAIEKYIKYYNEERIKEKLGWLSPKQYRLKHMTV